MKVEERRIMDASMYYRERESKNGDTLEKATVLFTLLTELQITTIWHIMVLFFR